MKIQKSNVDWLEIYHSVQAKVARNHLVLPNKVKMIRLCDLAKYKKLPVYQELNCLIDFDETNLDNKNNIILFISHRWHNQHIPDDGTLIATIFHFCLNLVLKNNFPKINQTIEIHQSKGLSGKLTNLLSNLNPDQVLLDQTHYHQFEALLLSLSNDFTVIQLIRHVLSRFYLWIDFCCLPQAYYKYGRVVYRTREEEEIFLAGLDGVDLLLQKTDCVILWPPSEITRAWLFYESLMSVPRGTCSFMMPMSIIAPFSTIVRQYHRMFSKLSLLNNLYMIDTFKEIGITATNQSDIVKIIFMMSENLNLTEWKFRVIE